VFSKTPMDILEELKKHYIVKGVGKPQYYLKGDVVELPPEWCIENCYTSFSAQTYIQNCLPKLASMFWKESFRSYTPLDENYRAELDISDICNAEATLKFKSFIGSANWIITLGHFDITYVFLHFCHDMPKPTSSLAVLLVMWMLIMQQIKSHVVLLLVL
jgi:hypothetical protein